MPNDFGNRPARVAEHSVMDVIDRILADMADHEIDRLTVVAVERDGVGGKLYSNARSEAEMFGMLQIGIDWNTLADEEEDDA